MGQGHSWVWCGVADTTWENRAMLICVQRFMKNPPVVPHTTLENDSKFSRWCFFFWSFPVVVVLNLDSFYFLWWKICDILNWYLRTVVWVLMLHLFFLCLVVSLNAMFLCTKIVVWEISAELPNEIWYWFFGYLSLFKVVLVLYEKIEPRLLNPCRFASCRSDAPKKISGVHKRCWRYIPDACQIGLKFMENLDSKKPPKEDLKF